MIKLDGASEAALNRKFQTFNELRNLSAIEMMKFNANEGAEMTEFFLQHEKFKEIFQNDEKFDLFMIDVYFNDVLLAYDFLSINHFNSLYVLRFQNSISS